MLEKAHNEETGKSTLNSWHLSPGHLLGRLQLFTFKKIKKNFLKQMSPYNALGIRI
jgi:hypothetical protein